MILPGNNLIYDGPLFSCGFAQINSGRFNAFMPHQIGEKSDVITAFQKALCKTMAKRMRVDDHGVQSIPDRQFFQLSGNSASCDPFGIAVKKNKTAVAAFLLNQPFQRLFLQSRRDVYPSEFSSLGIQIQISKPDVFHL